MAGISWRRWYCTLRGCVYEVKTNVYGDGGGVATLISVPACAGHFDFGLFGSRHSVDVNVDVDVDVDYFPSAVLIKAQGNRAIVPLQGRGDMTAIGDFEVEETKRSYSEVALGYKLDLLRCLQATLPELFFLRSEKWLKMS